ncbi:MAG: adenylate/guanylate cyclase domain-containing protein, partial [Bacteroidota bacterium]
MGFLIGAIEIIVLERRFRNHKLYSKILYKTLIYLTVMLLVIGITYPIAASIEAGTSVLDVEVWSKMGRFLLSLTFLNTLVQMAFALFV